MRGLFALTYALLWGLVVLEAVLLREILRRTVWFKRLQADFSRRAETQRQDWLRTGTPAPDFTAPLLGTGRHLSASDLRGQQSILLFVSPGVASPLYDSLSLAIHGMWHKTEGHLYLVCNGSPEACRRFAEEHRVEGFAEDKVPVIVDEGGLIAKSFLIEATPEAVALDEDARVLRYGRPEAVRPEAEGGNGGEQTQPDGGPAAVTPITGPHPENGHGGAEAGVYELRGRPGGGNGKTCDWPDERPYTGASFARMDTTVSCVLTRFRLRSAWSLIPFYMAFRRVRRSSEDVSGLLKAVFLIEDWRTCYTMSLWRDDCAIVDFGRVGAHITAANSAFGPTWRKDLKRAEIWSAQFRLWAVSAHNLNWEGLDLQTVMADQWARREEVARGEFMGEVDVARD